MADRRDSPARHKQAQLPGALSPCKVHTQTQEHGLGSAFCAVIIQMDNVLLSRFRGVALP